VVGVHPRSTEAQLARAGAQLESRHRPGKVHDRARSVGDEDRALRRARARDHRKLGDVDTLALESLADGCASGVVADSTDEERRHVEPCERHRGRRRAPTPGHGVVGRDDAVVRPRVPRHGEDRVERGEADADDHRAVTVTSSCGR
jgi:hypothetical protein